MKAGAVICEEEFFSLAPSPSFTLSLSLYVARGTLLFHNDTKGIVR